MLDEVAILPVINEVDHVHCAHYILHPNLLLGHQKIWSCGAVFE